jgi:hypothetical protein
MQVSDAILKYAAILSIPKLDLLDRLPHYQQICIKKHILTKPLDSVLVDFLFGKKQTDFILVFGRHFDFLSNNLFFQKKMNFKIQINLQNGKSLQIKSRKPAILDFAAILNAVL